MKKGFIFLLPVIVLGVMVAFLGTSVAFWAQGRDNNEAKASGPASVSSSTSSSGSVVWVDSSGKTEAHTAQVTNFCPKDNLMEGGKSDRKGRLIITLQSYLKRKPKANYVHLAADPSLIKDGYPDGTKVRIPELEKRFNGGQYIEFRYADSGGTRFVNTKWSHVDVAVDCDKMATNESMTIIVEKPTQK